MGVITTFLQDKSEEHQAFQISRRQELQQKAGNNQITPLEQAELDGLLRFQIKPREAILIMQEKLGNITLQQTIELEELKLRQNREKKFSYKTIHLLEKSDKNDPNSKLVMMSQGDVVEVSPYDNETKNILTFGLLGCTATMVFVETKDEKRICILTHFPPSQIMQNVNLLKKLIPKIDPNNIKIKKAVILCPGEYQKDENGKWLLRPEKEADIKNTKLENSIQNALEGNVKVEIQAYSMQLVIGEKDQGILVVSIPPVRKGDVTYRTNSWKINELTNTDDDTVLHLEEEIEKWEYESNIIK